MIAWSQGVKDEIAMFVANSIPRRRPDAYPVGGIISPSPRGMRGSPIGSIAFDYNSPDTSGSLENANSAAAENRQKTLENAVNLREFVQSDFGRFYDASSYLKRISRWQHNQLDTLGVAGSSPASPISRKCPAESSYAYPSASEGAATEACCGITSNAVAARSPTPWHAASPPTATISSRISAWSSSTAVSITSASTGRPSRSPNTTACSRYGWRTARQHGRSTSKPRPAMAGRG